MQIGPIICSDSDSGFNKEDIITEYIGGIFKNHKVITNHKLGERMRRWDTFL